MYILHHCKRTLNNNLMGATFWEATVWGAGVLSRRVWIALCTHPFFNTSLGSYSLGGYRLQSGGLLSQATDSGSHYALTCSVEKL